jgi:allantoinase
MSFKSIYSRKCWVDGILQPATVHIKDGLIDEVELGEKNSVDPLSDLVLMPGVIDVHVHINEPGRTDWEGFSTATKAAVAGGITGLVDMPLNSSPVTTSVKAWQQKCKAAEGKLLSHVGFYGGIVPGNASEILPLAKAGVLGYKCFLVHSGIDEFPNVTEKDLDEAMPLIAQTGLPLLAHCEVDSVSSGIDLSSDPTNYSLYVRSRPGAWEKDAVAMMIRLCRKHQCPIHIVHVSYAGCLELIRNAKEEGLPITAETCPHYIFFNEEEIPNGQTIYKCAPPVRDRGNNELLKIALRDGTLDFIASDHSPAPPDIKESESGDLMKAWGGIAGLQFLLSASWTSLMTGMDLSQFIPLLTEHPARFIKKQMNKGFIRKGFDADMVLWDPSENFRVTKASIFHRHPQSPYVDRDLYGKVHRTWVAGSPAFESSRFGECKGQLLIG